MSSLRYFETFYNADAMTELSETEAQARGRYVVTDGEPMRRYRRIIDNELDSLIYQGWDDPGPALADLGRLAAGVRAEIHSPVEIVSHGGKRWRTWHVSSAAKVIKILEREYDADGNPLRENLRSADGELISSTEYRYAADGFLLELVTRAPDGAVMSRQDA